MTRFKKQSKQQQKDSGGDSAVVNTSTTSSSRTGHATSNAYTNTVAPPPPPLPAEDDHDDGHGGPKQRRHGRTSSERGRAFRERQRQRETNLEIQLVTLHKEIQEKQFLQSIWQAKYFRTRHSVHGPLVAIAQQYYTLFHDGLRCKTHMEPTSAAYRLATEQEAFLHSISDPNVRTGPNLTGPEELLTQWRLHTAAYRNYALTIRQISFFAGSESNPIIRVDAALSGIFSDTILDVLFPRHAHGRASELLAKCKGKTMEFPCCSHLQFTRSDDNSDNRLAWERVEINFIRGFLDAGLKPNEVAELLSLSLLTPESTIDTSMAVINPP